MIALPVMRALVVIRASRHSAVTRPMVDSLMAQTQPVAVPDLAAPDRSVQVAQAAGMVSAQMNCSMSTALILLERRAELIGCSLTDLTSAVIRRLLRFGE